MPTQWFVETGKQAHAFLGTAEVSHTFRFNPDEVTWDYSANIVPYDTIGGRVLQVLSGKTNSLTINGRAGSRGELQRMAQNLQDIMRYQARTQEPVSFRVPSRQWNFSVYVQAAPQLGWSVADTSYPYQIIMNIQEDLQGVATQKMRVDALSRLAEGIGYNPDVHGGNAPAFSELVNSLQLTFTSTSTGEGGDGITGALVEVPADFAFKGSTVSAGQIDLSKRTGTTPDWVKKNTNLFTWNGVTLQEEAMKAFQAVCKRVGMKITASSSYRTYKKQAELYDKYLYHGGNLAARPGTSYHEIGIAVDVDSVYYNQPVVRSALTSGGFNRSVEGENWHYSFRVGG